MWAVITGATSGIGAAFARRFAGMGYDVLLTGRRADVLRETAQSIRAQTGREVETALVELSDAQAVEALVAQIGAREVDVLVNNAGFGATSFFVDGDLHVFQRMTAVHVAAPVRLTYALLPGMLARRRGTIINVSSDGAMLVLPKNGMYAATKAFLKTFSQCLALETADLGVRVQALCPGLTHTDFHEKLGMARERQRDHGLMHWMSPEEVVSASLRGLERGAVVCIPGWKNHMEVALLTALPWGAYARLVKQMFGKTSKTIASAAVGASAKG